MSLALPQPMLFDAAGHRCVGWWHAPQPGHAPADAPALPRGWIVPGPLPLTVVMVGSRGEEDLSAYDGQRQLAVALAEGGLGTLRFDWPDGGDSSAPTGQATLAELLATIDAAATQALALSGGHRLAFVGLRVGALLAAHAALARRDVEALIGLLPVAGGRAFVREQRMLGAALAVPADGGAAPADAAVALGGFVLSAAQVAELAALKWPAAAPSALRAALLLHRPGDVVAPVVGALKQLGASVGQWSHAELARALAIAHQASLAPPAIAEMVRWLQERAGAADPASAPPPGAALASVATAALAVARLASAAAPWLHLQDAGGPVRERVCRIPAPRRAAPGQGGAPLVGVLAERDTPAGAPAERRRAILLLSSGRERRVGPHRLWVPFARERAARGDVVLRLDIGAIGDSERRPSPDPHGAPAMYDARAVDDVARAVDWLRAEHGVGAVTVMGICSGAHHAWRAAVAGVDLQQVVAINPVDFRAARGRSLDPRDQAFVQIGIAGDAGRSLLDPARWRKLLAGRAQVRLILGALVARLRHALHLRLRDLARGAGLRLRDDLAAELVEVAGRGVALDFVFSLRDPGATLLREESGRTGARLLRAGAIKVSEVAHADHTFAGAAARLEFYARLDALLQPPPAAQPSSPVALSPQPATVHP